MDIGIEKEIVTYTPLVEPVPARPRPDFEPRREIPKEVPIPEREKEPVLV